MPVYYRFAIKGISYLHYPTYIIITLTTFYLCHLWLHYTDHDIQKHPQSRTIRGLTVPWGVYFCITGFKTIEQEEAGDSLIHTFIVPEWYYCQTYHFINTGSVGGNPSDSCGPIFTHHHNVKFGDRFEYWDTNGNVTFGLSPGVWGSVYFTPTVNHYIYGINLQILRRGLPGNLTFSIRGADADGKPVGLDIDGVTGVTDGNTLPEEETEWRFVFLSAPIYITAGDNFAVVIKALDCPVGSSWGWRMYAHPGVPPNNFHYWSEAREEWYSPYPIQAYFEIWGTLIV